jgi:hypothetical protein
MYYNVIQIKHVLRLSNTNFIKAVLLILLCWVQNASLGQNLKAGFNKAEYIELMKAYSRWGDSVFYRGIGESTRFRPVYRSSVVGLDNSWALYKSVDNIAVISIRGTTKNANSWLANFYAAMVPAKGAITLSDSTVFNYELAKDNKAAVHVGWLISTAFLSAGIVPRIDSCYKAGIKDFIILGHSQGGAIAYLLTSHLNCMVESGKLPRDIRFKTYCSAAPKPGNLYYAYEFERRTAGGWAFNVVNTADWVPETPVSIQTAKDFNTINPFVNSSTLVGRQKFAKRMFFKHLYSQLTKHNARAQRRYERYLGRMTSKYVKKQYPQFKEPEYYHSNNYVRVGNTVVLMPDEAYYKLFPNNEKKVFTHHALQAYLWLAERLGE